MPRFIYSLCLVLLLLACLPLLLLLLLIPSMRRGLGQRLGIMPRDLKRLALVGQGSLWVHAASLGEVNAIAPVAGQLHEKFGSVPLLITCTSLAGQAQAKKLFPKAAAVLLLPLDLPIFLKPLFRRFKPLFAVVAETEFWPNFLQMLKDEGCQVVLANGRMSERSLRRYAWFRPLFAGCLHCFDALAMQSKEDAERVLALGAKASRVLVTGNTKFDVAEAAAQARKKSQSLRAELGLAEGRRIIVAGSTRPGEEELVLEAFATLKRSLPELSLILAPRHMDRIEEVSKLVAKAGFKVSKRSQGKASSELILLDSLGELAAAYALGELAWIGGSWAPFGGQNPLEASAQGLPVIFGPFMEHFRDPAKILLQAKAGLQVESSELAKASLALLKDAKESQAMSKAAAEVLKASAGASQRTVDLAWKMAVTAQLRFDERHWREASAFAGMKVSEFGSSLEKDR
jgi:3-deoxy-D-manno-octulosonic-acid transferase